MSSQESNSSDIHGSEVQIAATFVSEDASKIHGAFGGSAKLNSETEKFELPQPYRNLASALKEFVPLNLEINLANDTEPSWEALYDRVSEGEARMHGTERSPREIFKKMWLKIGDNSDVIDPWVSLIPDSYGLAVVKSAIAIILKLAKNSADKRDKIFEAFKKIRDIIGDANSKRKSFQTDPEVSRAATDVYETIVAAIEEILETLPTRKQFQWSRLIPRLEKGKKVDKSSKKEKRKQEDPLVILEKVEASAKKLVQVVDRCRDKIIESTGQITRETNDQVAVIAEWIFTDADIILHDINKRLKLDLSLMKERLTASEHTLEILLEDMKKRNERRRRNRDLRQQQIRQSHKDQAGVRGSRALVTLDQLLDILCQSNLEQTHESVLDSGSTAALDLDRDLELVIKWRSKLDIMAQGQAATILNQDRFLDWMKLQHPDLILVNGNMPSSARDKISAISLFCATFVLSMASSEPDDVFIYFFCGLHTTSRDPWSGPNGLLRSMIVQILTALDEFRILNLDFLDKRSYIKELEMSSFGRLCTTFHELVRQFSPRTTLYCIIDGISLYELGNKLKELQQLVGALQAIVSDDELRPKFKVLMSVPGRSSLRLKQLVEESQQINLPSKGLAARPLTRRWLSATLSRPSTPSGRPASQGQRGSSRSKASELGLR